MPIEVADAMNRHGSLHALIETVHEPGKQAAPGDALDVNPLNRDRRLLCEDFDPAAGCKSR